MSEYTEQAERFLAAHGITFTAVLIGSDCPTFCEDAAKRIDLDKVNTYPRRTHIHGKHYRCTFTAKDRKPLVIDFWNSYADEEYNARPLSERTETHRVTIEGRSMVRRISKKTVTAYDVLACIEKSDPGTFEEFCSNFGYDTDSRKAEATWTAVREQVRDVERFFTPDELLEAQEIS